MSFKYFEIVALNKNMGFENLEKKNYGPCP